MQSGVKLAFRFYIYIHMESGKGKKRLDILTLDGLGCPPFPQDPELVLSSTSRDKKVL